MPHPSKQECIHEYLYVKKHIGRAEREILVPVSHRNYFFKSPMYMAFPTVADPADRAVGPLSPLPCQAGHGYGVSSAHQWEVRGCRRACERTPLRGRRRCAASGRLLAAYTLRDNMTWSHATPSATRTFSRLPRGLRQLHLLLRRRDKRPLPHSCPQG
jgi:hypothetical protein